MSTQYPGISFPNPISTDASPAPAGSEAEQHGIDDGRDIETADPAPWPLRAVISLAILVLLADWLFWDRDAGVSVAVFALALTAVALALKPEPATPRQWAIALAFAVVCSLPVIEHLTLLSLSFAFAGVVGVSIWVALGRIVARYQGLTVILRFLMFGPTQFPGVVVTGVDNVRARTNPALYLNTLILPVSVGAVFVLLLTVANPILEQFFDQLPKVEPLTREQTLRIVFWIFVACFSWPCINPHGRWLNPPDDVPSFRPTSVNPPSFLVNLGSVRVSLFLFNALFLVQTIMDIGVLTGGMSLPAGMTYAGYAHRGAYPLVLTALLAGVFAIITHKMIAESRLLKALLYLWLAQNLFLVGTAGFRLSLYVEAYLLTHLRIAAFIWMGLVFIGLVLIIVQVAQSRDISWLVRQNLISLVATLYLCCFVNFTHIIAHYNLENWKDVRQIDDEYICRLGQHALPAVAKREREEDRLVICPPNSRYKLGYTSIYDWREWSFRRWRLQNHLDRIAGGADL